MIRRKKDATLYSRGFDLVHGTQKLTYTLIKSLKCNYRQFKSTNNKDDTTSLSGDPVYKELALSEETGLKRGDKVELSDAGWFDDWTYEVLDRARHDKASGSLDNIIYKLKQIDG